MEREVRKAKPTQVDVLADNPVGTMERFNEGLRRVLAAPKQPARITGTRAPRKGVAPRRRSRS
jgi:hypothetical protein